MDHKIKTTRNLTADEVAKIPALKAQGYTTRAICNLYGVHQTSINYWFRRLRARGYDVPRGKAGRPPVKLPLAPNNK